MKPCRALKIRAALSALLLLPIAPAASEGVRTVVTAVVVISPEKPEGDSVLLGYSEGVGIVLPSGSPFLQGVEIDLRIPKPLQSAQGAFAWALYKTVSPAPSVDKYGYDGDRLLLQALPPRAGIVFQVPVSPRHTLRSGPYATVLPVLVEPLDFPLLFKLSALTKGVTPEQEQARYQVRIRPLFTDEGALRITVLPPEGAEADFVPSVYVDERKLESWQDLIFLKKGLHTVQVSGNGVRDESRSVALESGKVFNLEIRLQGTKPVIVFEAPANALIFLDDQPVDHAGGARIQIEPGERTVLCRIGDYTITRRFTAVRGKTYTIVFSVDVKVQEDP